jgi:putative heme-binding domain-containing protein
VALHLGYEKRLDELRAFDTLPLRGVFGLPDGRIIAPGDPFRSSLFYRISTEGAGRMPHIGSRQVDPVGVRLVRDWILSLGPAARQSSEGASTTQRREEHLRQLDSTDAAARDAALAALLSSMDGSLALVDHARHTPGLRAITARIAASQTNLLVRDLLQQLLPHDQRRVTLGADIQPQAILSLPGDAGRGRTLFAGVAQCAQCHPFEGGGRPFGPDLAGIGKKYSRAQVLEQILSPSRVIAPEFNSVTITMRDTAEFNGLIVGRSDQAITLRDQTLAEHRLLLGDIAELRESHLSAMPEGLLGPLTAQEAADLVEFLVEPVPKPEIKR